MLLELERQAGQVQVTLDASEACSEANKGLEHSSGDSSHSSGTFFTFGLEMERLAREVHEDRYVEAPTHLCGAHKLAAHKAHKSALELADEVAEEGVLQGASVAAGRVNASEKAAAAAEKGRARTDD